MTSEPQEFSDVTLYMPGMWSNIERIDVKSARIWVGSFAQYKQYVQCQFVEKGKRKPVQPDCQGYLVVVATASAITPDPLYLPPDEGSSVSATRYSMGSHQWQADFEQQLRLNDVPILADYRGMSDLEPRKELPVELTTDAHVDAGSLTKLGRVHTI